MDDSWVVVLFLRDKIVNSKPGQNATKANHCNYPTGGIYCDEKQKFVIEEEDQTLGMKEKYHVLNFLQTNGPLIKTLKFWGEEGEKVTFYRKEMLFAQLFLAVLMSEGLVVKTGENRTRKTTLDTAQLYAQAPFPRANKEKLCNCNLLLDPVMCKGFSLVCNKFKAKIFLCSLQMGKTNHTQQYSLIIQCKAESTRLEIAGMSQKQYSALKDALSICIRVCVEGSGKVSSYADDYNDHTDQF